MNELVYLANTSCNMTQQMDFINGVGQTRENVLIDILTKIETTSDDLSPSPWQQGRK
jgi:hypothetical protein